MNTLLTSDQWREVLMQSGVKIITATHWGDVFAQVVTDKSFSQGKAEIDDFLGQVLHESAGLTRLEENLNYSATRLMAVWPRRFLTFAGALPYARDPVKLANFVYADRLGNTQPGDGWRYRGRGPIQLTGRSNYAFVGSLIGRDLIGEPELMEQPICALEATIAWWEDRVPDSMLGDPEKVTRRVNGGLTGLAERERLTDLAREALA